jgi:hypothetical protein
MKPWSGPSLRKRSRLSTHGPSIQGGRSRHLACAPGICPPISSRPLWTVEPYGRAVVKKLDPRNLLISHSLFLQHCTLDDDRLITIRICDNNPVSFISNQRGILVNDFFGNTGGSRMALALYTLSWRNKFRPITAKVSQTALFPLFSVVIFCVYLFVGSLHVAF